MTVLLFVVTIVTFLGIDYLVRRSKKSEAAAPVVHAQPVPALRFPGGIFFSKSHTWLTLIPSGKVQLGIDDFASRMFSTPEVTLLKTEGDAVKKGESIIRLQEGRNAVTLRSPINGQIMRRNTRLTGDTAARVAANEDLFSKGWAYTIAPENGGAELKSFYLGAETKTWIKGELGRLRDFMAGSALQPAMMMQDGGEPMPGLLSQATPEECARFEHEFLAND
jgi:glycine cleavage system H protein